MSRARRWAVVAAVLLLAAAAAAALVARRHSQGVGAPARPAVQAIELAPGDVAQARRGEIEAGLAITGSLKAVHSAIVKAKVAAEVREILVREGDRVQAGQLIGRLDATEFEWRLRQADDQAAAAAAQLEIAERTLANNKALVDQGFISKTALETSLSAAAGARATLAAARAAVEIARKSVRDTEIRAPLGGLVAQRLAQPGERVPVDGRLVEIVDLSRIELEAAVAPEDVVQLRVGQPARVQVDGLARPLSARVARLNPSALGGSRAVMAYLEVEPDAALRQGLFARADVQLQRRSAVAVPASALRLEQSRPYVLVAEGGRVAQRVVQAGARGEVDFGHGREAAVEISAGVADGETVLRGSVGAVRAGTAVALPAGTAVALPAGTAVALPADAAARGASTAAASR